MKEKHGFEKVGYVPEKKSEPINVRDIGNKLTTFLLIIFFIVAAVVLFIYPGYFIKLFSELGYQFMN